MTACNAFSTVEAGEPSHGGNEGGHSIWYRWQAPTSGVAIIDLAGSSFDTLLAVYRAGEAIALNQLTLIAQNDDWFDGFNLNFHSRVEFVATAGVTYFIAVDGAKFCLSEVKLGLVPAVISPYVVATIGGRHARRLFTGAEVIDAAQAQAIGLVHSTVPAAELDAAVERALHFWAKGGPQAQREAKLLALSMAGMTRSDAERQDIENAALIARLRASSEGQAGMAAFLAKQPPPWAGA